MLKLWTWNLVVNKCELILEVILLVVSYELYNNSTGVYLEKNLYARGLKMKV